QSSSETETPITGCFSRIAVGIRRAVAAFQPHLVWTMWRRPFHEESLVEGDASARLGVELYHPSLDPVGIELGVDGAIKRVGDVHALAIAADLARLSTPRQRSILGVWMCGLRHDATDPDLAD